MDYLQPFDGPVIHGREAEEVIYAKDQPEYIPLRCLIEDPEGPGRAISRWTMTNEQRAKVSSGADIYLELMTFGQPLQPIRIAVGEPTELVYACRAVGADDFVIDEKLADKMFVRKTDYEI